MSRSAILTVVLVTVAYVAASEAVQTWLRLSHIPPIIWFASGVGVAAFVLRGWVALVGVALGAFICSLLTDAAPAMALLSTVGATAGIALTGWLLTRVFRLDVALGSVEDVTLLVLVGCTVIPLGNALIAISGDLWQGMLGEPAVLLRVKVTAMGEVIGMLLLVPVILAAFTPSTAVRPGRRVEAWLLQIANATVAAVVFGGLLAPTMNAESLPYALFPFTFWAAFRLGVRSTAVALLVSGVLAVICHSLGVGPFVMTRTQPSDAFAHYASLYLFLAVLSITSLLAAAARSEHERAEADVRESERRYRTLVERMNEGVNMTDADARLTFVSDRFCEMVGYSRDELIGNTGALFIDPEHREAWAQTHRDRAEGRADSHALTLRRKDGELRHVWISPKPQFDAAGIYTGSLNVVLDVTERRRAEDRAREHLDQLAHVSRVASMGEMASAIAHEINQPLTAIANYAGAAKRLMEAGKLGEAEALDTLARLAAEAERAGEVVRKMRGFVRGEEGQPGPVPVDELLHDVLRLCGPEARQLEVELVAAPAPDLPPVRADRIQLQQVLMNLVRNAMEAMTTAASAPRRVELVARHGDDGMVELCVCDTGPGIPEVLRERIFEPFYTTKTEGLGIGLALSRSIVEAHGGRLWFTATARGAEFCLTLPTS